MSWERADRGLQKIQQRVLTSYSSISYSGDRLCVLEKEDFNVTAVFTGVVQGRYNGSSAILHDGDVRTRLYGEVELVEKGWDKGSKAICHV